MPTTTLKPHVLDERCKKPNMRKVEGTRNAMCERCGRVWDPRGIVLADPKFTADNRAQAKVTAKLRPKTEAQPAPSAQPKTQVVAQAKKIVERARNFTSLAAADKYLIGMRDTVTRAFKDNPEVVVDAVDVIRVYIDNDAWRIVAFPVLHDGEKIKELPEPEPEPMVESNEQEEE
jgi:hypothetical protein